MEIILNITRGEGDNFNFDEENEQRKNTKTMCIKFMFYINNTYGLDRVKCNSNSNTNKSEPLRMLYLKFYTICIRTSQIK